MASTLSSVPSHLQDSPERPSSAPGQFYSHLTGHLSPPTEPQKLAKENHGSSNPSQFLSWAKSLVKERKGSILSRGMILKTGMSDSFSSISRARLTVSHGQTTTPQGERPIPSNSVWLAPPTFEVSLSTSMAQHNPSSVAFAPSSLSFRLSSMLPNLASALGCPPETNL